MIQDILMIAGRGSGSQVVSVGISDESGRVSWGDCVDLQGNSATSSSSRRTETLLKTIAEIIKPALLGRPLTAFLPLNQTLDNLTQTVHLTETIPQEQPQGVSRRELFRGQLDKEPLPPIVRKYTEVRPIPTSIRYGVSQALIRAVAKANGQTVGEVISAEYGIPPAKRPVPILATLRAGQLRSAPRMLDYRLGALAIDIGKNDPAAALGKDGANGITIIRHLKDATLRIDSPNRYKPAFYLTVHGGYEKLGREQTGKTLGYLTGLVNNAKPFPLYIEDAALKETPEQHLDTLAQLHNFIRLRKTNVRLVARAFVNVEQPVEAMGMIQQYLDRKAAHLIYLDLPRFGSLGSAIEALNLCRQHGVGVVWGGDSAETPHAAQISTEVALAVQPELVVAKPASFVGIVTVHNHMTRLLAEQAHSPT